MCYKSKEVVCGRGSMCSLKRQLPTLLCVAVVRSVLVSLTAMCNRGRSCKASAELLADYAEPQPTEEQSKPRALLLKLSSQIHTVQLLLTVD